jgi:ATP synthase subunit 6
MSALALLAAPLLALTLQAAPHAADPHAAPAAAQSHAPAAADHGGDHDEMPPGEIFSTLFKHLEPHAVAAVWLGGDVGFRFVKPYVAGPDGQPPLDAHGHAVMFHDRAELEAHYAAAMGGGSGWIIYNVTTAQLIAALLLIVVVVGAARSARRQAGETPRGLGFHLIESVVLYVRDDMVYPVMGKEVGRRFVPLFLTQFFFILCMNLVGLLWIGSLGGTATANLAVTGGMALTTLVFIHFSGIREHGFFHHWKNFVPHGLPWFVLPIIIPVEILGMLVKPAALTIRLFANMTAGHLVVLSFFGLIYLFGSYAIGAPALAMAIGIYSLELFVCFVQAYIFTYLSIIFVGASVHPEH